MRDPNDELRVASGSIDSDSKLVSFLYQLMRDHVTPGVVEGLVRDSQVTPSQLTNGWIAKYSEYLASQLKGQTDE
jgi:hypothetical protein